MTDLQEHRTTARERLRFARTGPMTFAIIGDGEDPVLARDALRLYASQSTLREPTFVLDDGAGPRAALERYVGGKPTILLTSRLDALIRKPSDWTATREWLLAKKVRWLSVQDVGDVSAQFPVIDSVASAFAGLESEVSAAKAALEADIEANREILDRVIESTVRRLSDRFTTIHQIVAQAHAESAWRPAAGPGRQGGWIGRDRVEEPR